MMYSSIKHYLDVTRIYPEFSYVSISKESGLTLNSENSKLGKLEVTLFDEKIIDGMLKLLK